MLGEGFLVLVYMLSHSLMTSHRSIYLTEQIKADRGAVPTATTREAQNIANTFF
jgi:hypothetical protein